MTKISKVAKILHKKTTHKENKTKICLQIQQKAILKGSCFPEVETLQQ